MKLPICIPANSSANASGAGGRLASLMVTLFICMAAVIMRYFPFLFLTRNHSLKSCVRLSYETAHLEDVLKSKIGQRSGFTASH